MPKHIKRRVAHALLMSNINYGIEVVAGSSTGILIKLEKIFNRIIRFVYMLKLRDHVTNSAINFLACTFQNYVKLRTLLCYFKVLKYGVPIDLFDSFNFLNSSRNLQINIPLIRYEIFSYSFLIRVARIWNCLPQELRNLSYSLSNYRKKLLNHLNL